MSPVLLCVIGHSLLLANQEAALRKNVGALSASTEKLWALELARRDGLGVKYDRPKVVLFHAEVKTACGTIPAGVGPFYCPPDATIYLDRTFFADLDRKLEGDRAEFAKGYVFARLAAEDVLNQAGVLQRVDRQRKTPRENEFGVRAELCASYLAGVWAHHAQQEHKFLDPKHAEDAIKTVRALGDDRLQSPKWAKSLQAGWTHGTTLQHLKFFAEGMKTGDASKARVERFFTDKFDPRTGELTGE